MRTGPKIEFILFAKNSHTLPSRPIFEYHAIELLNPLQKKNTTNPFKHHDIIDILISLDDEL
tara:strand:+ start:1248 stop:1433 length:186 start_codon:yes stop_codon:yes gene_type:complete